MASRRIVKEKIAFRAETGDEMAMSQRECARVLGVSPQAISNCERNALRKLRRILESQGLSYADFCLAHNVDSSQQVIGEG